MIRSAFAIGSKKFHKMIIPYALGIVVLAGVWGLGVLIGLIPMNVYVMTVILGLLVVAFAGWLRAYITSVLKEVEKVKK